MDTDATPLRVAIAGCHRQVTPKPGSHNWASAFAAVPETTVVAVFDRGAETREQFRSCWREAWGDIPAYDDYGRMLSQAQPDIVCVATRQTMHADQIEEAVAAGVRGILCDKPLATSPAEADRLLNACEQSAVPLAFGLDRRWSDAYRALRSLLAEGAIGTITGVAAFGVPNLINHGCHYYDAALALAGDAEPTWVSGVVDVLAKEPLGSRRPEDPPGRGWVGLDSEAHLAIVPEGGSPAAFTVMGTGGRLTYADGAPQAELWASDGTAGAKAKGPRSVDLPTAAGPWPTGPAAVRDLVKAVRSRGRTACDVQEARRATEIGFAVHASSAVNGARVPVPISGRSMRIESFLWGNE